MGETYIISVAYPVETCIFVMVVFLEQNDKLQFAKKAHRPRNKSSCKNSNI